MFFCRPIVSVSSTPNLTDFSTRFWAPNQGCGEPFDDVVPPRDPLPPAKARRAVRPGGELVKRGKKITIGGKDYEETPEGKLTLNMLGIFSEYERTKIMERMTRGRLHRLRKGELSSNGHRIYGYRYVKKTETAPAMLAINEEQAAVVRMIFEMFGSGDYGLVNISRFLEERRVPTRAGRPRWDRGQIKFMLKNETYTGTRYYNRITAATDANGLHQAAG
jgi:Recombinase/Resolvase, N terminal domain